MSVMVIKKNKVKVPFDANKILVATAKSAERVNITFTEAEQALIVSGVLDLIEKSGRKEVTVPEMHRYVELTLDKINPVVADSYRGYRNWKQEFAKMMDRCAQKAQSIMYLGSKENSNSDSSLVSTKRSLIFNEFNKELYKKFFLTEEELRAIEDGYIYIHDMSARRDTFNCCLFDIANIMDGSKGGFYMNNQWYNCPKSLDTFGDVCGDLILSAASQQYGGFTVPEIDKIMEPYAEMTYQKSLTRYITHGLDESVAETMALEDVEKEMRGCFQGWEYKFNTVASSRGDYPFITFTFGLATSRFGKMAAKICLETRKNGQGRKGCKKPVLFPKLVFLYDEKLHGENGLLEDVFEEAIDCTTRAMYPDFLSLSGKPMKRVMDDDGEFENIIVDAFGTPAHIYKKYGKVISPMGCRAFLSPWYERGGLYPADETDEPVYVGRFNIGAVSLHLPMILAKAKQESKDFFEVLEYYLQLIRKLHLRTYEYLGRMKASCNPLAFCEGGLLGGNLNPNDVIEPLLDSATASFGITALNEFQRLYNGKSLVEDHAFALQTMQYINNRVECYKKEDGRLYAIYGTPAENLCGKQIQQFRKRFGIIQNVSDKEYVSNSFHCHVTEDLEPTQKQDIEEDFWDLFKGGRIQYCRYPVSYNRKAIIRLVRRAMSKGYYEGINMSLAFCEECGYEELDMDVCPRCHSQNITKIDRMNGYLSFSRTMESTENSRKILDTEDIDSLIKHANTSVKGESRLSEHKNVEISERKSM